MYYNYNSSGQCHCWQGFGGRQCTECEQFHWGDPQVQCGECKCEPLGSEMAQCDRVTGACQCREGTAGRRCDECAHGFTGTFPKCVRCHPCFELWDDAVCMIRRDLDHIRYNIQRILESGETPGVGDKHIHELENKLAQVQDLIRDGDRDRQHQLIGQSIDDLRAEIALTDGRLMGVTRELNGTAVQDEILTRNLTQMERDLMDLNTTLVDRHQERRNNLSFGFQDQFDNVKKYYRGSQEAHQKCSASVSGPFSPVEESKATRSHTEDLLNKTRDVFLRTAAAQKKSLSELQDKAQDVDEKVHHLSHQVCGGHSNTSSNGTCHYSPCGGAGCRDDGGQRVCGGDGCKGTVSVSLKGLKHASDVSDNLTAASEDLRGLVKKLHDIAMLTQDVKSQAMDNLDNAKKNKDFFENSNKKLKEFIQKIKYFLTEEGADPESIEKVAQQVLAISLPVNRTTLDTVVQQIKDHISNLTDVQGVFNHTSQQLHRAKELLNRAKDAKTRAEGVKDTANRTKQALDASQKAIQKATKALDRALNNLNSTRNATATVEENLQHLETNQMGAMMRLANLSMRVEELQDKIDQNMEMAQHVKNQATNATHAALGLEQRLNETDDLYKDLQMKVDSLGGASGDLGNVNQRAKEIKKEAEDLLTKADKGIETLRKLERKFRNNEQRMLDQHTELGELERNATDAREAIRQQVQTYNNCN
ncbi:laminin subunit beta-2-like [Salvelinus namaycush]|uniref:Laminin subunit beta-2-like n=1 Tax=Salvelinus namaycush TaxID=8040 RepID=A0A8U1F0L5_SALNM|nr:laminin subunit beta-2-like [Salvelinus namaycush]